MKKREKERERDRQTETERGRGKRCDEDKKGRTRQSRCPQVALSTCCRTALDMHKLYLFAMSLSRPLCSRAPTMGLQVESWEEICMA